MVKLLEKIDDIVNTPPRVLFGNEYETYFVGNLWMLSKEELLLLKERFIINEWYEELRNIDNELNKK